MAPAPLLLAIESATADASAALLRGADLLAKRSTPPGRPASEALLPTLLVLLEEAGSCLGAVDAFAVSVGPGSFTGLRVGVATVKGLAFGAGPVVVPVPTLAALATRAAPAPGPVAAVLDARRGEVYAAIWSGDPLAPPRVGPAVLRPEALATALAETLGPAPGRAPPTVVGEGVPVVARVLRERFGEAVRLLAPPAGAPDAEAVGRVGARLLAGGVRIAAADLVPVYVRRAEAEVRRTGERFEETGVRFDTPRKLS